MSTTDNVNAAHAVQLRGVEHEYVTDRGERVLALKEIDLAMNAGEFVCVVGPSGCGKSTMLKLIAGFMTATRGEVRVGGDEVNGPGADRGVVFQSANLFPWLTVQGNVELADRFAGVDQRERARRAQSYLKLVGLEDFADAKPYELSGGMQQRCQIARVLAAEPAIMLMDEPFGALDPFTRADLQDKLHEIWVGSGEAGSGDAGTGDAGSGDTGARRTVFFITHSIEEAVRLGTRVLVMSPRPGRIVADVPVNFAERDTSQLRTDPEFLAKVAEINGMISS